MSLGQAAVGAHISGGDSSRRNVRLLAALAVTQTVGYGVLYYSFAVLLDPLSASLGASATAITGALAVAVLVAGAAAIPVGHRVDRRGGRVLMTAGSIVGAVAVAAWSHVQSLAQLYAVFVLIGVASAMALYEPAFAVIVRSYGAERRTAALLAVTIVAGFASSIFLPVTGLLVEWSGWRAALLVLAILYGLVTIPVHAGIASGSSRTEGQDAETNAMDRRAIIRAALRDRGFWLLAVAFIAHGAAVSAIAVHLIAYLVDLGHRPTVAASVAGLLGVLSVTGRVVTTALGRRRSSAAVTAATFALQASALAALPVVGRSLSGAVGCVIAFGLGFGVGTIARPTLLAERYGTSAFGALAGILTLPAMSAKAGAPLGAAALATAAGTYTPVIVSAAAASLSAAGCLLLTRR